MPRHLLERLGELAILNMLNSDLEIHAIRAVRIVEEPAGIISTIIKSNVGYGSISERNSSSHNTGLHRRSHGRHRRDRHLHVRTRGEQRRAHPVFVHVILEQDPFAYAALAVIVTCAEFRIITRLLERGSLDFRKRRI